jgi:hypothetical protein
MEPYVAHSNSKSTRHTEGLNGTIKVLVIDGVLIMPHSSRRVGHLVGKQAKAIVARGRVRSGQGRSRPSKPKLQAAFRTVGPTGLNVKLVMPVTLY